MNLYFDENIPEHIVAVVRGLEEPLGYRAIHTPEEVGKGASDEEIFKHISKQGGVLLTHDKKMHRRPHQLRAMIEAGIGVVVFTGRAERNLHEQAVFVLEAIPAVLELVARTVPPFVFGFSDRGVVRQLASKD